MADLAEAPWSNFRIGNIDADITILIRWKKCEECLPPLSAERGHLFDNSK